MGLNGNKPLRYKLRDGFVQFIILHSRGSFSASAANESPSSSNSKWSVRLAAAESRKTLPPKAHFGFAFGIGSQRYPALRCR